MVTFRARASSIIPIARARVAQGNVSLRPQQAALSLPLIPSTVISPPLTSGEQQAAPAVSQKLPPIQLELSAQLARQALVPQMNGAQSVVLPVQPPRPSQAPALV